MAKVYIEECKDYSLENVQDSLKRLLINNNLLSQFKKGEKIAIKANLVAAFSKDFPVATHPSLLFELTKLLVEKGCKVVIGDSAGGLFNESFMRPIYNKLELNNIDSVGGEMNHNYSHSVVDLKDSLIVKQLDVSNWLEDADYIINFAKLKSHGMMSLSAATKNMFGSVPGTIKLEYHYKYPNHVDFGKMLIDIQEYYKPVLHIVDAIDAMEGNGPTQGNKRHVGLLLASTNCYDLDNVCCHIIDLDINQVTYIKEAMNANLCCKEFNDIELSRPIDNFIVKDFEKIIHKDTIEFYTTGKLKLLGNIARKVLETKPVCNKKTCIGCKKCFNICPAHAITMINNRPIIDRSKCIKCFCCQEFCPVGSMKTHRTLLSKIIRK